MAPSWPGHEARLCHGLPGGRAVTADLDELSPDQVAALSGNLTARGFAAWNVEEATGLVVLPKAVRVG